METKAYKQALLGGKQNGGKLSSLSSQKADLRAETTAFRVLVWAYADESIRACGDESERGTEARPESTILGRLIDGVTGSGRGSINGFLLPHEDALAIDAVVWRAYDQNWSHRAYLAAHMERRVAPPHPTTLEPQRRVPRLRANGKPYVLYDLNRNPVGVLEDLVGHDAKQIAYAEYQYAKFLEILDALTGLQLSKWRVLKRGLTDYEESLTKR